MTESLISAKLPIFSTTFVGLGVPSLTLKLWLTLVAPLCIVKTGFPTSGASEVSSRSPLKVKPAELDTEKSVILSIT